MTHDEEVKAIEASVDEGLLTKEEGEALIAALGPRFISDKIDPLDINGYILAGDDHGPMLVRMDGTEDLFIPIFSTKEKLVEFAALYELTFTRARAIEMVEAFVDGMRSAGLRIIVDPYRHENGRMRYIELKEFEGSA